MKIYRIKIAKLRLWLEVADKKFDFIIPPGHQKFQQPVLNEQADFTFKTNRNQNVSNKLVLTMHEGLPEHQDDFGLPLLQTPSWDLWESQSSIYTLFIKEEIPPRLARIDHKFTVGDLFVGFSNNSEAIYPPGQLETRLFSLWLSSFGDIILHASGVEKDGKGYCFLGESGAGKSTLARVLAEDPQATILGEDTIILRYLDGGFRIFGTPWHLDPDFCSPAGVPLEKMFFLDRFKQNGINLAPNTVGISQVLQTAVIPYYHPVGLSKVLDNLVLLSGLVPFFNFSYRLGADAWKLILTA